MAEHKFILVELVNGFFRWVSGLVGLTVEPGREIIPSYIVMAAAATLIIIVFFKLTVKNLHLFPSRMQHFLEMVYRFFQSLVDDVIGPEGRSYIPALGTLGLFIAVSNLIGLLPEMESPTANWHTTFGCALFIVIYYHSRGVKKHGFFGYLKKSFLGPVWWLSWLFLPIEIVQHFISRPLSLTMRLFGNIFAEDLVIIIIASLVPFVAPIPMMAMAIFTSLLQSFIFVMLSTIYLAGAAAEEH